MYCKRNLSKAWMSICSLSPVISHIGMLLTSWSHPQMFACAYASVLGNLKTQHCWFWRKSTVLLQRTCQLLLPTDSFEPSAYMEVTAVEGRRQIWHIASVNELVDVPDVHVYDIMCMCMWWCRPLLSLLMFLQYLQNSLARCTPDRSQYSPALVVPGFHLLSGGDHESKSDHCLVVIEYRVSMVF